MRLTMRDHDQLVRYVKQDPVFTDCAYVRSEAGAERLVFKASLSRLVACNDSGPLSRAQETAATARSIGQWWVSDEAMVAVTDLVRKRFASRVLDEGECNAPPLLGMSGVRDPGSVCEGYIDETEPAALPNVTADCQSDGHFLCQSCRRFVGDAANDEDDEHDIPF